MNKSQLAIQLSKLNTFSEPKVSLEQYQTESEIAAEILWLAYLNNDIENKTVADLGCGNGIFGIGSLILGAKKVIFLDNNKEAITLTKLNLRSISNKNYKIINKDIKDFKNKVDTVIQNPPFGTKIKHSDKTFLEKAFSITNNIYSIHKSETKDFLIKLAKKNNFTLTNYLQIKFKLKRTMPFHKKQSYQVNTACFVFKKQNL